MSRTTKRNRWYDREEACHRMLESIREMAYPEAREFCARVIIHFTQRLQEELRSKARNSMYIKSLGEANVSSLYGYGRDKRRWYDEDPLLHRAVGELYTMPPEALTVIGFKLGDTFGLIEVYAKVCMQSGQLPIPQDLVKICTTALQVGTEEARIALEQALGAENLGKFETPRSEQPD